MAASKTSLLDEILVNLLLILSGMFLSNASGWLLWRCTHNNLLFGFMYGLKDPLVKSKVTSKKLTIFLLASIVILRP